MIAKIMNEKTGNMTQLAKVKKLVVGGDPGSLQVAVDLLLTLKADENAWISIFSKAVLKNQFKSRDKQTLELLAQVSESRPRFRKLLLLAWPQTLDWLDSLSEEVADLLVDWGQSVSLNGIEKLCPTVTPKIA